MNKYTRWFLHHLKIRRLAPLSLVALALVSMGVIGVGATGIVHIARSQGEANNRTGNGQTEASYDASDVASVSTKQKAPAAVGVQPTDPATNPKTPPKYSISSDPRSTAYSTTPPAPNPASFTIKITHNGQLSEGDTVYYNATKGEKGYYDGDLVVAPSSITISKSNPPRFIPITISSPNNRVVSMPSTPWDDHSTHFGIASLSNGGLPPPSLSHNLVVDAYNVPAPGSYKLHITSGCDWGTGDGCQSDFFITINVVE